MKHTILPLFLVLLAMTACAQRSYLINGSYGTNYVPTSNKVEDKVVGNAAALESEHVSKTSYDPFTEVGRDSFSLNLDDMANDFAYPIYGSYSSGYGYRGGKLHTGMDISAPAGTPIYSVFKGTVRMSKNYGDYGNVVVVRHDNGLETVYGHNSKNLVKVGDKVDCGEKIALCGHTGNATGDHLHFEVRVNGEAIDPELLLDKECEGIHYGVLCVSRNSSGVVTATLQDDDTDAPDAYVKPASAGASKGIKRDGKIYDAPVQSQEVWHTIVRGDTLSQIARKYKVSVAEICRLNNIRNSDVIKAGQKIKIK